MHDMNNNNSNKYYYKPMPYNQHQRPHHPTPMFDNQRNDYYNGPPGYINPNVNNTLMMPNAGYNHFSNSYPGGGSGPFYRDFRQNWQPPMVPAHQSQPRPLPPPPPSTQSTSVSQTIVTSQSSSSLASINFSSSSSSSLSRSSRPSDDSSLQKLKQHLAVTQKELSRVIAEKVKLAAEEIRLQTIVDKAKQEIDRLESRLRDPRVKNRSDNIAVVAPSTSVSNSLNCDQSTPSSLSSSFSTSSVPLTLSTTSNTSLFTTSVPSCGVQDVQANNDINFSNLHSSSSANCSLVSNSSSSSMSIGSSNSMLQPPLSVQNPSTNENQSNSSVNGSMPTFTSSGSLMPPTARNVNKNLTSRGKQLNNLVQFKALPLMFDIFPEEVLKPEIYHQNQTKVKISFTLKPIQMEQLRLEQQLRVLLRICYVKAKKTSQSDRVSRKLVIRINTRPFLLGKQTNGSIKAPLDITQYCTENRNELELSWPENEPGRDYGVGIFINHRYAPDHALSMLKTKDYQRPSTEALKMIAKNFATSGDICSEEIMVPLCCPITKKRLEIPAIGIKCEHLLCFDAKSFLDINQKRSEWHCPSCKKAIGYNDLRIDCLIADILSKTPSNCLKVSFDRNGQWHPVIENKEKESTPTLIDVNKIDIITLEDSDDENMKGCDAPDLPPNTAMEEEDQEEEDEEDDEETEQEEEEEEQEQEEEDEEEEEEEDEEDDDDDDDDDDDENDEDEEDEEGEITDKGGSDNCGRYEKSRRYEDDPDFVYSGTESEKSKSPSEPPLSNGSSLLNDSTLDEDIRPPASIRERKKKQLFEIFGSDPDSRENSPDSSVQSPVTRCRKRRRERSERRCTRKGRRHH